MGIPRMVPLPVLVTSPHPGGNGPALGRVWRASGCLGCAGLLPG